MGGFIDGTGQRVTEVYLLANAEESAIHFSMHPKEQIAALRDMRSKGLVLLGNFHSHPASPAIPSREDIRLAYDCSLHYLILSLAEPDRPILNSFHIEHCTAAAEQIMILP